MSTFEPERPEGATFHECDRCEGTGTIIDEDERTHIDCPDCDGTGEWFE